MDTVIINLNNPSKSNTGKFQGWGTSLCWWANRIGYSQELTEKAAKLFFSEEGLNFNIMRYNIGGGDSPDHKHIKRTDSIMPGWMYYDKKSKEYKYDYNADLNQRIVLKACYKEARTPLVELFSNSPPFFMTKSGCSSGGINPNENNLNFDYIDKFAEYLAHITDYIQNTLKIEVCSLSPMNEPNTDYWHYFSEKQEGCHFDCGKAQNDTLLATYHALKKYNLNNVILTGSDETSTDKALESYNLYSDEVKAHLPRINTHTYGTEKSSDLRKTIEKEGKNLWMSESDWGGISGENAGEMGAGIWLAEKIIKDINELSPSAWVLWQTIDYHKSKNGYMGNKDFGIPDINNGYWGLSFADHDNCEIILTQKYYCMGQFSKYINIGDTIYHINENFLCAANKKEVKLIAVNNKSSQKAIKIDLTPIKRKLSKVYAIRTSGSIDNGEHWAKSTPEEIINNIYISNLKGNSVTTFIFK